MIATTYCHGSIIILVVRVSNSFAKFQRGQWVIPAGVQNTGGLQSFCDFPPITRYISQTIQDSAIVTMER